MNQPRTFFPSAPPKAQDTQLNWKSVADLADKEPPKREFAVDPLLPKNQVSSIYGDGGTGKSLIAKQLCVCVAADQPWFGLPTAKGRAIYLTAEDDDDELHRRFYDIARGMGLDLKNLPDLHYETLIGQDALFAAQDRANGSLQPTGLYEEFCAKIDAFSPEVAVIDTLADINPADENQRSAARQFVQLLRKPAVQFRCTVIVLAHPSLTGMNSGTGTSGSTGWNNSVRSRLYFRRPDEEDADPDLRVLELMKSNYSRIGEKITLRWKNGVFFKEGGETYLDQQAQNAKAKRIFLQLLDAFTEQGREVNGIAGSNFAPNKFAQTKQAEGLNKRKLRTAMEALFHEGKIINLKRPNGRGSYIVRKNT